MEGLTARAATGYTRSAIQSTAALAVDNLELEGLLEDVGLSEDDFLTGLYDHARIQILLVNWADLSQGVLHERHGWLGEVTLRHGLYVAELRGLTQALSRHMVEVVTPDCAADLFDARCQVNPAAFTITSTVTTGGSDRFFFDTARTEPTGYFEHGELTWLTGANAGVTVEIKAFTAPASFELWLPLPELISTGDQYRARAGCDKQFSTCVSKFDNHLRFRGFPHVPGTDFLIGSTPDAKPATEAMEG